MEEATIYAFGIPNIFIYLAIGVVIIGLGFYLSKKSKSKK